MKIAIRLATLLIAAAAFSTTIMAQSPQDARITVLHPGVGALKADLKSLIDLTLPAEQSQWENIEGYIDTFSIGVDEKRPVYVSVITGVKPNATLIWVPLAASQPLFKEFRENLESLGYEVSRDTKDQTLYQISQDPEYGWLKLNNDTRYAVFVLASEKSALSTFREVVVKATMPDGKIEGSMIAEVLNGDVNAEAQKHRRESYAEVRRVSMEAVKKRPDESATEFELRSLAVKQQLDEGERLLAEAARLGAVLNLDRKVPAAPVAALNVTATAIPETSLSKAIAQIGTRPDAFGGVAKFAGSALSVRFSHPVDEMRQANITEFLALTEKDMSERLKASRERTDAEKEVSRKVTTGVLDVVRASIADGWVNAFVESVPDGKGDFVSIAAFTSPAAAKLTDILPEISNAGKGSQVEMNIDKQGEVTIHRVQLAEGYIDLVDKIFGVKKDLFIGVGATHVWLASGVGGKEKLKETIAALGEPKSSTHPIHVEVKLLPWVQRFEDIAKKEPVAKTPEEQEIQREWARRRARAIASFQTGGDVVVLDFNVENGEVKGSLTMEPGLLRFAGKLMSAFSKANFE